jgi:predicted RNA binding protein YcfA (HicA-like mRNA interferase family)
MKPVTGRAFCRALERKEWRLARIHGSHRIYVDPSGKLRVSVPVHGNRDLKKGLQAALIKLSGLGDADFQ